MKIGESRQYKKWFILKVDVFKYAVYRPAKNLISNADLTLICHARTIKYAKESIDYYSSKRVLP